MSNFKLPNELLGGAVKVIRPTDLRNRVGMYMMEEHGIKMGCNVDPGDVQDMIVEFAQREIDALATPASTARTDGLERRLAEEFKDQEYASGYAEAHTDCVIATSIKVLREQRGWTQEELASKIGTQQASISRMEDVNYACWSLVTLKKLAEALGVRVKVTFEDFSGLPAEAVGMTRESLQLPAAPGVPQAGITTAGEMRTRIAAATDEEMQPLRDALRIAVDHFGSDDSEQAGVPQAEPPKEEKP